LGVRSDVVMYNFITKRLRDTVMGGRKGYRDIYIFDENDKQSQEYRFLKRFKATLKKTFFQNFVLLFANLALKKFLCD
jgi:hypothetical protein